MPYLIKWSEIDHSAYCLALLFTYRDFSDGALGLAWVAETELEIPGGICSKKVLLEEEHESLSFNTALATLLNYGVRLHRKASVITVMHELGHSFGSEVSIPHLLGQRGTPIEKKTFYVVWSLYPLAQTSSLLSFLLPLNSRTEGSRIHTDLHYYALIG